MESPEMIKKDLRILFGNNLEEVLTVLARREIKFSAENVLQLILSLTRDLLEI